MERPSDLDPESRSPETSGRVFATGSVWQFSLKTAPSATFLLSLPHRLALARSLPPHPFYSPPSPPPPPLLPVPRPPSPLSLSHPPTPPFLPSLLSSSLSPLLSHPSSDHLSFSFLRPLPFALLCSLRTLRYVMIYSSPSTARTLIRLRCWPTGTAPSPPPLAQGLDLVGPFLALVKIREERLLD